MATSKKKLAKSLKASKALTAIEDAPAPIEEVEEPKIEAKEEPKEEPKVVKKEVLPPVLQKVEVEEPKPETLEKLPVALPSGDAKNLETTVALRTTNKMCGQWFKLVTGKKVTGTTEQIAYLRSFGLVK